VHPCRENPCNSRLKYAAAVCAAAALCHAASAENFTNRKIPAKKPAKTVDAFGAVRIMRRSFARQGVAGGLKNASKPVDRSVPACIMVDLLGKNPGPLFNSTIK